MVVRNPVPEGITYTIPCRMASPCFTLDTGPQSTRSFTRRSSRVKSRGDSIATYHEFVSGLLLKVRAGPLGLTMTEKLPPAMFDKSSSIASGQAFASLHPTPTMKYSPGGASAWEVVRPLGALGMAISDCAISDKFEPSDTLPRRQVSHRKHPALREQLSVPILRSCLFLNLYSEKDFGR